MSVLKCKICGGIVEPQDNGTNTIVYVTSNGKGCASWKTLELPTAGKPDGFTMPNDTKPE